MNTKNKARKEGKTHEKNHPQGTMHQNKKRKLLRNYVLHSMTISQRVKKFLSEDVNSLFRGRIEL
jgi:hypothetical protein